MKLIYSTKYASSLKTRELNIITLKNIKEILEKEINKNKINNNNIDNNKIDNNKRNNNIDNNNIDIIGRENNIYNRPLQSCSTDPLTGYHRRGYCLTDDNDKGTHTVCAKVDDEFLEYTKGMGNDLSKKNDEYNFPGLKKNDKWCLCALRWRQALKARKAPPLDLEATNLKTLDYIDLDTLENYKI